jgi:hypothetical protein
LKVSLQGLSLGTQDLSKALALIRIFSLSKLMAAQMVIDD